MGLFKDIEGEPLLPTEYWPINESKFYLFIEYLAFY